METFILCEKGRLSFHKRNNIQQKKIYSTIERKMQTRGCQPIQFKERLKHIHIHIKKYLLIGFF